MPKADGVVKSARRVLEIFEYFAERRCSLTLTDIEEGLGFPQSSTSALMRSLTKLGYLDFDRQSRLYTPTLRVAMFGGWIHDQMFSRVSLTALIDELHRKSGGTVVLGMQNEIYMQYIHLVQPTQQLPWYIRPGSLRSLCRTALGRVLLSKKTDVEVLFLLRRINAEEQPEYRVGTSELIEALDEVRRQGYAYTSGMTNPHAAVVAMELPAPASQPAMAIGIGGPTEFVEENKEGFLQMLKEAIQPYRQAFGDRASVGPGD